MSPPNLVAMLHFQGWKTFLSVERNPIKAVLLQMPQSNARIFSSAELFIYNPFYTSKWKDISSFCLKNCTSLWLWNGEKTLCMNFAWFDRYAKMIVLRIRWFLRRSGGNCFQILLTLNGMTQKFSDYINQCLCPRRTKEHGKNFYS